VKNDFLEGWKYEIELSPGYKVMWENQYHAKIFTPDGLALTNSLFADYVGFYARNGKHAERKVIKMIRNYLKNVEDMKSNRRSYGM
jgi:hypothetical protein